MKPRKPQGLYRDTRPLEKTKQGNFIRFVNAHEVGAFAVKVEAGGRRGFPDLLVGLPEIPNQPWHDGAPALTYYVEWKRDPRSKIYEQQKMWCKRLRAMGHRVSIHSNVGSAREEFLRLLKRTSNFTGPGMGGEDW